MSEIGDASRHKAGSVTTVATAGAEAWITAWRKANFAMSWYGDAVAEAREAGPAARRRETLFAVYLVESYLYEWVRDSYCLDDELCLLRLFPAARRVGIKDRWKGVLKQLFTEGLIPAYPGFGSVAWSQFASLVKLRDGLVHGAASRPVDTQKPSSIALPVPDLGQLDGIQPGWPTNTAVELIESAHLVARTTAPEWLRRV
jgi:hypothetical protein